MIWLKTAIAASYFLSLSAIGQGVLPRGPVNKKPAPVLNTPKSSNVKVKPLNIVDEKVQIISATNPLTLDCIKYVASHRSFRGQYVQRSTGLELYYLKAGKRIPNSRLYEYHIVRISPVDMKYVPVMKLDLSKTAAFAFNGHRANSLSLISWLEDKNTCEATFGALNSFSMDPVTGKFKPVGVKYSGNLAALNAAGGLSIYDDKVKYLLEIDSNSFQVKKAVKMKGYGYPLFVYQGNKKFLFISENNGKPSLDFRLYGRTKPLNSIGIEANDRVVIGNQMIGLVRVDDEKNTLSFSSMSVGKMSNLGEIRLPEKSLVSESSLVVNYKYNVAIIFGKTPLIQSQWARIYGYNLKTGKSYFAYSPPKGYYIDYISVAPTGDYVIFDLRRSDNHKSAYLVKYILSSEVGSKKLTKSKRIKYIKF